MRPAKRVRFSVPKTPIFEGLPVEIVVSIFGWVSTFRNLRPLRRICKHWKWVIDSMFAVHTWTPETPTCWYALETVETVRKGFVQRTGHQECRIRFATGMCIGPGVGFNMDRKGPGIFWLQGDSLTINKHRIRRILKLGNDEFLIHFNNGFRHHNPKWAVIYHRNGKTLIKDQTHLKFGTFILNGQDIRIQSKTIPYCDEITATKTKYGTVVRFDIYDMYVVIRTIGISMSIEVDEIIVNASIIGSCIVYQSNSMKIFYAKVYRDGDTVKHDTFTLLMENAALDGQHVIRYNGPNRTLDSFLLVPKHDSVEVIGGRSIFRFTANMPPPSIPNMTLTRYGFTFDTFKRRIFGFFYIPRPAPDQTPPIQE